MAKPKKPLEAPGGRFFALPHAVLDSEAWRGCSAPARALLMEVCRQHTGSNNGHLHLARTWMESRGWNRPATVIKLRHELERRRLLVQTRHGGLNNGAHRFALTWLPVSNFTGLDITARDYHPGAYLLAPMPEPDKKQNARTPHVRKKAISETSPRTPHVHNEYIPIPTAQIPRTSLEEPITEATKTAERPNRNNHQPKEQRKQP